MISPTALSGAFLIQLNPFHDNRGWLVRTFDADLLHKIPAEMRVQQCVHQYTARINTLRGLYIQMPPYDEAKLIAPVTGAMYWVIVDLRRDSKTFGRWESFDLSAARGMALYVPRGFANGCLSTEKDVVLAIAADNIFSEQNGVGIAWNDPELGINWPIEPGHNLIISDAHAAFASFATFRDRYSGF